jgi:hypothetical protein
MKYLIQRKTRSILPRLTSNRWLTVLLQSPVMKWINFPGKLNAPAPQKISDAGSYTTPTAHPAEFNIIRSFEPGPKL